MGRWEENGEEDEILFKRIQNKMGDAWEKSDWKNGEEGETDIWNNWGGGKKTIWKIAGEGISECVYIFFTFIYKK